MGENHLRLFIAIEIPETISDNLSSTINEIKDSNDKVKWIKGCNMHITLKFLGDVEKSKVNSIKDVLLSCSVNRSSFNSVVKGFGMFLSGKVPKVMWTGVSSGDREIKKLFYDLEDELAKIGFAKEKRSYTPHITIGRVKKIYNPVFFSSKISKYNEKIFGNFKVDSISLIESAISKEGAVYNTVYNTKFTRSPH